MFSPLFAYLLVCKEDDTMTEWMTRTFDGRFSQMEQERLVMQIQLSGTSKN